MSSLSQSSGSERSSACCRHLTLPLSMSIATRARPSGFLCPYTSSMRCSRTGRYPRTSSSGTARSEEHTSELQSPCNLVCRLLLEKKKKKKAQMLYREYQLHMNEQPIVS